MRTIVITSAAALIALSVAATAEQAIKLKPGPGADKVEAIVRPATASPTSP